MGIEYAEDLLHQAVSGVYNGFSLAYDLVTSLPSIFRSFIDFLPYPINYIFPLFLPIFITIIVYRFVRGG